MSSAEKRSFYPDISLLIFPFFYFSSIYSTCLYNAIEELCSMEAADWLESLTKYVQDFDSIVNLGCTPERPTKPGN